MTSPSQTSPSAPNPSSPPPPQATIFEWPLLTDVVESSNNDSITATARSRNRGSKLHFVADASSTRKPGMWMQYADQTQYIALDKGRRAIVSSAVEAQPVNLSVYAGINLMELWGIPDRPEDVRCFPSWVHDLRERALRLLGDDAMVMIEEQQEINKLLGLLLETLFHDDPSMIDITLEQDGVPEEVIKKAKAATQNLLNTFEEYLIQLQKIRDGAIAQHNRKKQVAKKLAPFPTTMQDEERHISWTGEQKNAAILRRMNL